MQFSVITNCWWTCMWQSTQLLMHVARRPPTNQRQLHMKSSTNSSTTTCLHQHCLQADTSHGNHVRIHYTISCMSTESQLHILLSVDTWSFTAAHPTQCFPPHLDSQVFCSVVTCTIHSDHAPKYSAPAGFSHVDISSLTSSYQHYYLQLFSIKLKVDTTINI